MAKRIAFHHFGCKVNFSESSSIARQFREKGYEIAGHKEPADIYVISTCAVTREAEKKCIYAIRQAHRLNPEAKIAVIGCFPELNPEELKKIEGVSLVLGQSEKFRLPELLEESAPAPHSCTADGTEFTPSFSAGDRTRSFLKIQDGCDYFCAYCAIPFARGRSRSDTVDHVVRQVREIADSGIREIILTGINLGDFGRENGETFLALLASLDRLENLPRIRISSIEPDLLGDEIIALAAASPRIMPHFHIPLQSGSDKILKAMRRKYDTRLYTGRIEAIRARLPLACIAADVIVGFPGETDAEFETTVNYLEALDVSYLHVFSYSKREQTTAAGMQDQVPANLIRLRSERLHRLSELKKQAFYANCQGLQEEVLFESDNIRGFMHGFTRNYIKVKTPYEPKKVNTIVPVKLERMDEEGNFII